MTCTSHEQAAHLLETVGCDARGLVSIGNFNARLGVMAAPPPLPPEPGACARCLHHVQRFRFSRKQDRECVSMRRYELGEQLSE